MRADPDLGMLYRTPVGEYLHLDTAAKLEKGYLVAVFLGGSFMFTGRIDRRPVSHRRLVIRCRDVDGKEGITRIGLRGNTQGMRVLGVLTLVPFADAAERGGD